MIGEWDMKGPDSVKLKGNRRDVLTRVKRGSRKIKRSRGYKMKAMLIEGVNYHIQYVLRIG